MASGTFFLTRGGFGRLYNLNTTYQYTDQQRNRGMGRQTDIKSLFYRHQHMTENSYRMNDGSRIRNDGFSSYQICFLALVLSIEVGNKFLWLSGQIYHSLFMAHSSAPIIPLKLGKKKRNIFFQNVLQNRNIS